MVIVVDVMIKVLDKVVKKNERKKFLHTEYKKNKKENKMKTF